MKTQKEINQAFKTLVTTDLTGYDLNKYPNPWAVFMAEYGWSIAQYGGEIEAVKHWMLGLPSILNMPFTYFEIGNWLQDNTGFNGDCFDSDVQMQRYWLKAAMIFVKTNKPN